LARLAISGIAPDDGRIAVGRSAALHERDDGRRRGGGFVIVVNRGQVFFVVRM
jgi:hypothetical protein